MTTPPEPLAFTPYGAESLVVTAVGQMTPPQLALITTPFLPNEKPKAVATLQDFTVSCDVSAVELGERFRLTVWLWLLGSASRYATLSYNPTSRKYLKSGLWRVLGGQAEDATTVVVSLLAPAKVARLVVTVQGLYEPRPP